MNSNPPAEWGVFTWAQQGRYARAAAKRVFKREGDAQRFADRENEKDASKNFVVRPLWPAGNPPEKRNPSRTKVGRGIHLVIGRPLLHSDLNEILDGLSRERKTRPLRAPHHTVGMTGMFGETRGEWWLAEGGVLYMEEAADFLPSILRKVFELFQSGQGGPAVVVMHVSELGAGETRRFERVDAFSRFNNVFEHNPVEHKERP